MSEQSVMSATDTLGHWDVCTYAPYHTPGSKSELVISLGSESVQKLQCIYGSRSI